MPPTNRTPTKRKAKAAGPIRYAVVGLGHISQAAMLPAFRHARRSAQLAALVSSDAAKLRTLGKRYKVDARYGYDDLEQCIADHDIDAVYIATPNTEHADLVIRAAQAGAHVLCEKPLCIDERQAHAMIHACRRAGVHLMTAYRLHFDAATLKARQIAHAGKLGDLRWLNASFSYQIQDDANIRLDGSLGGGALFDIGIYCINAARTLFEDEPHTVHAIHLPSGDPRFKEVDETTAVQLHYPRNRCASFFCSFNAATTGWYELVGTKGSIRHDSAFEYAEGSSFTVNINDKKKTHAFAKHDQFAAQLLYFSMCINSNTPPEPSGEEGLADIRIINALHQSIKRGKPIALPPAKDQRHPRPSQRITRPATRRKPPLVKARSASGS